MTYSRKIIVSASAGVLLLALAYGVWQWLHHAPEVAAPHETEHATTDTLRFAENAPQLSFIKIMEVEAYPEPLAEALNARLSYDDNHTARVFSPINGRVLRIVSEVGKQVKANDPLLALDSPDYAQAVADSARANADLLSKQMTYQRARQLLEINGIARKEVEQAEADLHSSEAEARRARARLRNLGAGALRQNEFLLHAPIAGMVSERMVSAGSEVRPDAADPLFIITDPRHLWLLIDLPEGQLDKISVGQRVAVEVDAWPNETFEGRVTVIGGAMDPVTRRIQARCEVDNTGLKLKPEMFARVTPIADKHSVGLPRIPNSALFTQGLYSYIFVEQAPGVMQRRRVTLAMQGSDFSYVKEGLRAGERVVASGALLLNSELSGND
jgi:cobalt-zinc-cadmium efflux system membrane fusion protein